MPLPVFRFVFSKFHNWKQISQMLLVERDLLCHMASAQNILQLSSTQTHTHIKQIKKRHVSNYYFSLICLFCFLIMMTFCTLIFITLLPYCTCLKQSRKCKFFLFCITFVRFKTKDEKTLSVLLLCYKNIKII